MANETLSIREAVTTWGRARWPDARVLYEVACGERRVDILFVREADVIGVEIKAGTDTLGRLDGQAQTYNAWFPEWWLAIAPRWRPKLDGRQYSGPLRRAGILVVDHAAPSLEQWVMARRDELTIMRMTDWLWADECRRIAERTDVWPGARRYRSPRAKLQPMLARLLTGNHLMREICRELRARPLGFVGAGSDSPVFPAGPVITKK